MHETVERIKRNHINLSKAVCCDLISLSLSLSLSLSEPRRSTIICYLILKLTTDGSPRWWLQWNSRLTLINNSSWSLSHWELWSWSQWKIYVCVLLFFVYIICVSCVCVCMYNCMFHECGFSCAMYYHIIMSILM